MSTRTLKASIIIGGSLSGSFRSAMSSTTSGLKQIGEAIAAVERRQRMMGRGIESFVRVGKGVEYMRREYSALALQADKLRRAQTRLADAESMVSRNRAKRTEIGGKLRGATATFGVVAAATMFPVRQAVDFESAMVGVAKQVNGARDASGRLTPIYYDMRRQIIALGRELPFSTNKIAEMVEAGARMGIPRENLAGYVREVAKMGAAFEDISPDEIAESMGRISGIFKLPISRVNELGDAINHLDDNAQSKGSDIIRVLQGDLAGASTTIGLSVKNAAALGSTLLTLGESAERADTAAAGMLRQLQIAKMNPKRFQVGIHMLGLTGDQLQKGMIADPQKMILDVLGRIKKLPVEQQMEAVTRLFGKDWGGAIAKLANGVDEYRRQLELANGAAAKGSMSREFEARMQATAAQWQITKNRINEVSVALGSALLPAIDGLFKTAGPVVSQFAKWADENPRLVKGVIGGALALTGLRVAALGVSFAFHTALSPILKTWRAVAAFRAASVAGNLGIVGKAVQALGRGFLWLGRTVLMNPLFLIGSAVAGLAYEIYKHWDGVKTYFGRLWTDIKQVFGGALKVLKGAFTGDFGKMIDGVKQMFTGFKTFVSDIFKGIVDGIGTVVEDALQAMGILDKEKKRTAAEDASLRKKGINPDASWADVFFGTDKSPTMAMAGAPGKVPVVPALRWNTGEKPPARYAPAASGKAPASAPTTIPQPITFNITQQPGESSDALARRVLAELDRRERRNNAALRDHP
ncbi:MAG: phage tail tape measure protein [Rhodanobacter sp.]